MNEWAILAMNAFTIVRFPFCINPNYIHHLLPQESGVSDLTLSFRQEKELIEQSLESLIKKSNYNVEIPKPEINQTKSKSVRTSTSQ